MNDNETPPRRAANSHLAQQLPAHGPYAGPSAHSAPHDAAGPGSFVIPSRAVPSAERFTNVVEAKLALNTQRRGTVQAAEGLTTRDVNIERTFAEGFGNARAYSSPAYEVQPAGRRSPLADGSDGGNATWQTANVMGAMPDFVGSAYDQSLQPGNVPPLRPGSTPSTMTDLSRLDLTERGRTSYGYVFGSDFKVTRRNEAEVND